MTEVARPGRPTRDVRSRRALKRIDLDAVDPKRILREIAADTTQPAGPRVAACRELNAMAEAETRRKPLMGTTEAERDAADINQRALAILARSQGRVAN